MKITNKSNLPDMIYNWLKTDFYDHEEVKGSLSATTMLKPVQEIILNERHRESLEVDAADRIWTLFGSGVHEVFAKMLQDCYPNETIEQEERLKHELDGIVISGKYDVVYKNCLYDFKTTSAFTLQYGSRMLEWIEQLSIYRYLYYKSKGKKLEDFAYIQAILRDWAERNVGKNNYPDAPLKQIIIKLDPIEETEKKLKEKIKLIKECRLLKDNQLPSCTDKERWYNEKQNKFIKCGKYCIVSGVCEQNLQEPTKEVL